MLTCELAPSGLLGCPGHRQVPQCNLRGEGRPHWAEHATGTHTKKGISWVRVSFWGLAVNSGTAWMTLFMTLRR